MKQNKAFLRILFCTTLLMSSCTKNNPVSSSSSSSLELSSNSVVSSEAISSSSSTSIVREVKSLKAEKEIVNLILGYEGTNHQDTGVKAYNEFDQEIAGLVFSYQIEDESIVSEKDGKLTPLAIGKTKVTVSYESFEVTITVCVHEQVTAKQVNSFKEPYFYSFGRPYKNGVALKFDHVCSGFELSFYGESLNVTLNVEGTTYARMFIDGDKEGTFLKLKNMENKPIVENLSRDIHTIRLLKSSELTDGQFSVQNFSAEAFYNQQREEKLKLEFIGDSITTGYGVLGRDGEGRGPQNSDSCSSYAFFTAQNLNADISAVALEGICVEVNMWQPTYKMSNLYKIVSPFKNTNYTFDDGVDIVVLNLGTNDATYMNRTDSSYAEKFSDDYTSFLRYIRSKRKDAIIICMYGNMGKNAYVHSGIKQAIENIGDDKIYYYSDIPVNNSGAASHPSLKVSKQVGQELANYIQSLLEPENN